MARQRGPLKMQGTLGDINFYKSQDGYLVREKGGVDGKRIKKDPVFQRTRENGQEFGRAARAGKLLRTALRPLVLHADNRVVSRLQQQLMKVLQADVLSARGLRNVTNGNVGLLTDFEFNVRSPLGATFLAPYVAGINRVTGAVTLDVPAFVPVDLIAAPAGTTHYKIISGAAEVDFTARTLVNDTAESAVLPWNAVATATLAHALTLPAGSTHPLFLAVCIAFYQEVNGEYYLLHNGAFNSSAVLRVDVV